jgi:hypothetical protein
VYSLPEFFASGRRNAAETLLLSDVSRPLDVLFYAKPSTTILTTIHFLPATSALEVSEPDLCVYLSIAVMGYQ